MSSSVLNYMTRCLSQAGVVLAVEGPSFAVNIPRRVLGPPVKVAPYVASAPAEAATAPAEVIIAEPTPALQGSSLIAIYELEG